MGTTNAISLCRVSTHRQSNENNSLGRQDVNVDKAAEQLDATITRRWSVATSSKKGKNLGRKDLNEILQYCGVKKNKVTYCIIDEVDRFLRSIEEYYWYKVELKKRGVRLIFAVDSKLTDESQEATFREMIAIYNAESDNTVRSNKSTNGMKGRLSLGYWPFPVKAGYQRTLTAGIHEPDPSRFPLLQKAMRMVIARTHTVKEAQVWLKDNGYRTASGGILDLDKFTTILKEPFYYGQLKVKDWPQYRGIHKPMITSKEFDELQVIISGRVIKKRNRHYNPEFPGQKLLSCGKCGSIKRTTGSISKNGHGGEFARYYCMSCKKYWNRDKVHEAVEKYLSVVIMSQPNRDKLRDSLIAIWRQKNNDRHRLAAALSTKITDLNNLKSSLTVSYATASETMKPDIEAEVERIRNEINDHEERRQDLLQDDREIEKFITFAFQYLDKLCSDWWSLEPEPRTWCQKIIFPGEIIVYPDYKIGTNKLSPIFTLQNAKSSPKTAQNAHMVELPGTAPGSDW